MAFKGSLLGRFLLRHFRPYTLRKAHTEVVSTSENVSEVKTKVNKEPFMKNIFLGVVDSDILSFPEVELTDEDSALIDAPFQIPSKALVSEGNLFQKLLKTGICRLGIDTEYGGSPCSSTRLIKEIEKLDISPTYSFLLDIQYSLIIENILKYGSEQQKNKYLKDLLSGTAIGAYAAHEENSGSDLGSIRCTARASEFSEDTSYILNGEKTWITNANIANFFIVLAQYQDANRTDFPGMLTAFIVDKDTPGVTVSKHETLLNEYDICQIKFDKVAVSQHNLLGNLGDGYKIAVSSLESNKFMFAVSILNLIRKLSSQATIHICQSDRFPLSLREYEMVQYRLSKLITTFYALESSIFHLAGMKDLYEMDTSLESAIVQNLIYTYGFNAIQECLSLLGHRALDYTKSTKDNLSLLSRSFTSPEFLKFYISLKGVEHCGSTFSNTIMKSRNPLNFPGFIFKKMWNSRGQLSDSPKLDKYLYMHYHPSLKIFVDQLEYCICRLQYGLETLLTYHGKETVLRQVDLVRLADVASDIYAMVAVLARASRSYCTGIRYYDQERIVANSWCQEAYKRVKINIADVVGGKLTLSDYYLLKLAPDILQNKGYFFACPTEKNIQ